ncbi:putative Xaa-Pro aminopeptidase 3 [Zancudomyces culisetae]|uniref:Putative Xaa-Pro aminopeptidase 3 n=1 Tax=Zancudomyces culisetae TaxID=1213189 RepID=A0A1R1PL66_ZANCU|nr:putative Xaa-Pro aminopeptidase 3 [Zancudomyces culisetae]|eukprot:OMH81705.1 putative Xaa-Pro aminopeptidase 3 [Zancudomyces culisetae]
MFARKFRANRLTKSQRRGYGLLDFVLRTPESKDPITKNMYGQAMHKTNPGLISQQELAPGFTKNEFHTRRVNLMKPLNEKDVVVVFGADKQYHSPHIFYPFRQDANFYYLTGWAEPNSALVLQKDSNVTGGYKSMLFCLEKDHNREIWEGSRNGIESAVADFGFDEAFPVSNLTVHLRDLVRERNGLKLYAGKNNIPGKIKSQLNFNDFIDVNSKIQKLRLIKSDSEIKMLQKANDISLTGYLELLKAIREGVNEDSLANLFEFTCKKSLGEKSSLTRSGYVPVFAGGDNSLLLHYTLNNCNLNAGDLLLIDAGMEYAYYNSDISRTYPVNKTYTPAQKDLYNAVLHVQESTIDYIAKCRTKKESLTLNNIHSYSSKLLSTNLRDLGFVDVNIDRIYPHHVSHYLGIQLHDTVDVSLNTPIQNNMVFTIEPGLYIPYDDNYPKHFHGMGIRIEDNIVTKEDGIVNLSKSIPKKIEDIERIMNE